MRRLTFIILLASLIGISSPGLASVFNTDRRWPDGPSMLTRITVCVNPASSPGFVPLEITLEHVRNALAGSWEKYSKVRFVGWKPCTAADVSNAEVVKLLIQDDIDNYATWPYSPGHATHVQFASWGKSFNRCRGGQDFSCVEQYAIHEFGHVLGFEHEWLHPEVPSDCPKRAPQSNWSRVYPAHQQYIVAYPRYDWNSIMTYWDGCVDQVGVRFGGTSLSQADIAGVREVYPLTPSAAESELDFGGAFGQVNGASVVNPATGMQTCPAGYTTQQIYGTGGNDYAVSICSRPSEANPIFDLGGAWGYVERAYSGFGPPVPQGCGVNLLDQWVLGTPNIDYPLHLCYRLHANGDVTRFGGVVGTVERKTIYNAVTLSDQCPPGYLKQQVLGTNGIDWPLYVCFQRAALYYVGADFGGAWGKVSGSPVNNPITSASSCPPGFQAQQILGTDPNDEPVFTCFRPSNYAVEPTYDFGGMWGYVEGIATANPLTGKSSCPEGYKDLELLGTVNKDYGLHVCYRPHAAGAKMWFGGFVGTVDRQTVPNALTQQPACPYGYLKEQVYGTRGSDWPLFYCYAFVPPN